MIKTVEIKNFKSIRELKLDARRINLFIGEPNTGKSNILETVGLFSYLAHGGASRGFVRFERVSHLFYDEILEHALEIKFGDTALEMKYEQGRFTGSCYEAGRHVATFSSDPTELALSSDRRPFSPFKFYRFAPLITFGMREGEFLYPPLGLNLLWVLLQQRKLMGIAQRCFSPVGLKLYLKPQENRIEVVKEIEDVLIAYPYALVSETLQRVVFHIAAVLSNKGSIIALEEPEAHAFPYYTKYLAETIALDENKNQYFISTHNPYFLLPLLEKSPKEDIAIFITYFDDYQTRLHPLSEAEMEEITELDIFSNLDRFLESKK